MKLSTYLRSRLGPAIAFIAGTLASPAFAAPALQQVPGYYVQTIGQMQVVALFDGAVALARQQIKQVPPAEADALLLHSYTPESKDGLQTAVNAFLIRKGAQTLLIDTGTAQCFGKGLGKVLPNLHAAGVASKTVQHVLLTHAHPDHLCGLLDAQGKMAYPQAQVWLNHDELQYWLDPQAEKTAAPFYKPLFAMARNALAPYLRAKRVHTFHEGDTLPAGVRYVPAAGHTVGHSAFLIDGSADGSQQHQLLLWGDVVHYPVVQFANPAATYEPDVDYAQSVRTRQALLALTAQHGWWLAGAHMPFPGIGHVVTAGAGYRWVPTEFSPLPAQR